MVASGDCPGQLLDRHLDPLARLISAESGAIIDLCGWDGGLCSAISSMIPAAAGACNSHLIGSERSARANLEGADWEVRSAFGIDRHQAGQFEIAVVRAPYWLGNRSVEVLVRAAWMSLAEGGLAYLCGQTSRGLRTFARMLRSTFGNISNVRAEGGSGIVKARRERGDPPGGPIFVGDFGSFGFESGRRDVAVARHPAVFSDGVLDNASRMLIESLPDASGRQLDLGCGSGAVAAAMSIRSPDSLVTAVDVSAPAVEACRETMRLNGLANVDVFPSYFGENLADRNFDIIACYPPFHVGPHVSHEPARRLIQEAARLLDAGGSTLR